MPSPITVLPAPQLASPRCASPSLQRLVPHLEPRHPHFWFRRPLHQLPIDGDGALMAFDSRKIKSNTKQKFEATLLVTSIHDIRFIVSTQGVAMERGDHRDVRNNVHFYRPLPVSHKAESPEIRFYLIAHTRLGLVTELESYDPIKLRHCKHSPIQPQGTVHGTHTIIRAILKFFNNSEFCSLLCHMT